MFAEVAVEMVYIGLFNNVEMVTRHGVDVKAQAVGMPTIVKVSGVAMKSPVARLHGFEQHGGYAVLWVLVLT